MGTLLLCKATVFIAISISNYIRTEGFRLLSNRLLFLCAVEDYIVLAKDKYGYNGEQALGMLFWHKHDLERAVMDLANFTPFPDEWSVEDKVLFEQAFQFHGKSFHRIRQMVSVPSGCLLPTCANFSNSSSRSYRTKP